MKFSHYATRYIGCRFLAPGNKGVQHILSFCKNDKANGLFDLDKIMPLLMPVKSMTDREKIDLYDNFFNNVCWIMTTQNKIDTINQLFGLNINFRSKRFDDILSTLEISDTCTLVDHVRSQGYDLDGLIEKKIAYNITKL